MQKIYRFEPYPLTQMVPGLMPQLLSIVQHCGQYEATVVRRAVAILRQGVNICMEAEGPYKVQARQILLPHLQPWLQQFCAMLATSAASQFCVHTAPPPPPQVTGSYLTIPSCSIP